MNPESAYSTKKKYKKYKNNFVHIFTDREKSMREEWKTCFDLYLEILLAKKREAKQFKLDKAQPVSQNIRRLAFVLVTLYIPDNLSR